MKFDFKNLFSKKKKMNVENLEDELNLDDLEDELDLEVPKSKSNIFKNIDFSALKGNKKVLYSISAVAAVVVLAGGSYYYYLMKSTNIELTELKKPLPEIKKIKPRKTQSISKKKTIVKNDTKIKPSIKPKKEKTTTEDIFSSVMKNEPIKQPKVNNKPVIVNNNFDSNKFQKKHKKLNIKNKLNISDNKIIPETKVVSNIDDKKVVKELEKDETLLKEKYLPLLINEKEKSNKDIYALTDEELLKLKDMDKYIEQKQKYMEKVTKFLIKKQKYLETLKNFEEFKKLMRNQEKIEYDKKMKQELENKIAKIEKILDSKLQILNNSIQKIKEKAIVTSAKNDIKNSMEIEKKMKENEKLTKKNIEEFFKGGQIFIMNDDYIIAVTHNGMETIYKKGQQVLDGFTITNITSNMITLEKNNKIYFYNLKTNLGTDMFSKVVIELPLMVDNSKEEDKFNKKLSKNNKNNKKTVPKYLSPDERKKLEAKKFFNLTTN